MNLREHQHEHTCLKILKPRLVSTRERKPCRTTSASGPWRENVLARDTKDTTGHENSLENTKRKNEKDVYRNLSSVRDSRMLVLHCSPVAQNRRHFLVPRDAHQQSQSISNFSHIQLKILNVVLWDRNGTFSDLKERLHGGASVSLARTCRNLSPSGSNVDRSLGPHKYLSSFFVENTKSLTRWSSDASFTVSSFFCPVQRKYKISRSQQRQSTQQQYRERGDDHASQTQTVSRPHRHPNTALVIGSRR